MAKFKKFDPQEHIRGLAEAARQIRREHEQEEARNFEECMQFFKACKTGAPKGTPVGR